jgi:hypothetical protein
MWLLSSSGTEAESWESINFAASFTDQCQKKAFLHCVKRQCNRQICLFFPGLGQRVSAWLLRFWVPGVVVLLPPCRILPTPLWCGTLERPFEGNYARDRPVIIGTLEHLPGGQIILESLGLSSRIDEFSLQSFVAHRPSPAV